MIASARPFHEAEVVLVAKRTRAAVARSRRVVKVAPKELVPTLGRLRRHLRPFLPLFAGRSEVRQNAAMAVEGLLSGLPRKSVEPIAEFHNEPRRALQRFVGAGGWRDEPLVDRLVAEVEEELGCADGALIVDGSGFPKKGTESVGVKRQWCGRLGKVENCQVGVFLAYASREGHTLVDERLYLPEEWASSPSRREKCYVPETVEFRKAWELADEMIAARSASLPHGWVLGDDEFGRVTAFRDRLAARGERYMLDVPANTHVRIRGQKPHAGRPPGPIEAREWAAAHVTKADWTLYTVRNGAKGPYQVEVAWTRVDTKRDPDKKKSPWDREETLLVIRTVAQQPEVKYCLSRAVPDVPIEKKVQAACSRSKIEDCLERAKGEVGLDEYEVRSWTGWHHHMTLGLLALWFLVKEHRRLRRRFPPLHGSAGPLHRRRAHPRSRPRRADPGDTGESKTHAERGVEAASLGPRTNRAGCDCDSGRLVGKSSRSYVAQ